MPGGGEGYLESFYWLERFMVVQGFKMLEGFPRVFLGKQRLRLVVFGELLAEGIFGVFLLKEACIWQQNLAQFMGGLGAVNLAFKAVFHQGG